MSAHMESKAHFDALVTHGVSNKVEGSFRFHITPKPMVWNHNGVWYSLDPNCSWANVMTPNEVGQMLYDENAKSVSYRYPGDADMVGDDEAYEFEAVKPLTAEEVIFACKGYVYQSCEHPEFYQSNANAYVTALMVEMAGILAEKAGPITWSIDEEDVKRGATSLADQFERIV
jgi:hypothetical protein